MHDLPEAAEPLLLGHFPPLFIVSLAMLVLLGVMLWKKVPGMVTGALDQQIAAIREQFAEAAALRAEAEQLRADYAARITSAEAQAAEMLAHAHREAEAIVARAEADTTAMVARREQMAKDKIAAAERAAIDDLRRMAVEAATSAAHTLIAARHGADADRTLVDGAIERIAH